MLNLLKNLDHVNRFNICMAQSETHSCIYSALTFLRCCRNRDSRQVIYDVIKCPPLLCKLFKYGDTVLYQYLKHKRGKFDKKKECYSFIVSQKKRLSRVWAISLNCLHCTCFKSRKWASL